MINFQRDGSSIFASVISIIGLFFYLYGFFPFSRSDRLVYKNAEGGGRGQRHVNKLAVIVIDSLRYDFVHSDKTEFLMPFVSLSILNNESCLISVNVDSPTVTMPRIKAMTSGTLSNYIDVVRNLMSSNLEEDSFIKKAVSNGLKVVFYGDDTWLKLFPKKFHRSEGTNSFFVMDFTEVDNNVTRHIDNELQKNDWDIIILHYLGLDHIGHVEGPGSSLVPPKLREMDNVVKKISSHFKSIEIETGQKTMLLVTGDHGMKDSGGHGGVTYAEVTVPLVSVGNPCKVLPGWPETYTALQVDLAPTLCILLGLSFPQNSVGKLIPNILHWMTDEEIMKSLEMNYLHLLELDGAVADELHYNKREIHTEKKSINAKYFADLNQMSQNIVKSKPQFIYSYLILGLILLWSSLLIFIYQLSFKYLMPEMFSHWFLTLGLILHALSLSSSSFIEEEHQTWYFLWLTLCIFIIVETLHQIKKPSLNTLTCSLQWIAICFIHRTLRKLNQTGDKWAFLPDIKTFLNSAEGKPWLVWLFVTGLVLIFKQAAVQHQSKWQSWCFGLTLFCIFSYRLSTGSIKLKFLDFVQLSRDSLGVLFWLFATLYTFQTFYYKTQRYFIWLLLASLLLRPHNTILLPIEVFMSKTILRSSKRQNILWINMAHIWLGHLFYFYQGNGNSLANIDVAPAFIGTEAYSLFYAVVMVTSHTFNGQILSYMLSPKLNVIWSVSRLVPLTFYCTFLMFQLDHLFIWSVFSPKLLYESCMTLLFAILMFTRYLLGNN